jgi:hypothetical protein
VSTATTSALIVVYAPAESPWQARDHALHVTEERVLSYVGGEVLWRSVVPGEVQQR